MGERGDGPRRREPMSNVRFFALLIFILMMTVIIVGAVNEKR